MTPAERRARTTSEIVERARLIAESLELGVAGHNGVLLTRGERLDGRIARLRCRRRQPAGAPDERR